MLFSALTFTSTICTKIKMGKWWGWCDTVVSTNNYKDTDVVIGKSQGKYQKSIFSHKVFLLNYF